MTAATTKTRTQSCPAKPGQSRATTPVIRKSTVAIQRTKVAPPVAR
jgi:hypothetical protein